jgi:hypothetical protein
MAQSSRFCLAAMLRLVEDGILVRNTRDDDDFMKFMRDSVRLTQVLKDAQEALATQEARA